MQGTNLAFIIGHVGQAPKTREAKGFKFTSLSVATNESWTDKKSGEAKERTEWHDITVTGNAADFVQEYVAKGDMVSVAGQLRTEKWEDKDGNERRRTYIAVGFGGRIELLVSTKDSGGKKSGGEKKKPGRGSNEDLDDDVPF